MIIAGVDIGVAGAIAILSPSGSILAVHDMPVLKDGPKQRNSVNAPLLADILANSHAERVLIEWVGVRPGEGAVGAFAFGRSRGVCEGVCAGLGLPVQFITSPAWKRLHGIAPGKDGAKDAARSKAIARWPNRADLFKRVRDDGRAESCLIAAAGLMLEGGGR
jgi:crossover junction endodeoxyribonuclease RuvC